MFETFNVPCFYVSVQGVLALYSSGRTTGLVLDSGEGITSTLPIYEGYAVPHAIQRVPLAGRHLTEYMRTLLEHKGHSSVDLDIARDVKEKMCYAASNYDEALRDVTETHANDRAYDLPDGKKITLGAERFKVAEVLFNPTIAGFEMEGIPKLCFDSAMRCDVDVRRELLSNMILAGGSTLFEGMGERMW